MKKLILALTLISTPVFARQISLNAQCVVNRFEATCEVYNYLDFPVYCEAKAIGVTRFGANAVFSGEGFVFPGQSMYVNVHTYNPYNDPLVDAYATTRCSF